MYKKTKPLSTIKKITNDATTLIYIELLYRSKYNNMKVEIDKNTDYKKKYKIDYDIRTIQRVIKYLEAQKIIRTYRINGTKIIEFLEQ